MQWHQLDLMQTVCTSLQTDNYTNTRSLNFFQAVCYSLLLASSFEAPEVSRVAVIECR